MQSSWTTNSNTGSAIAPSPHSCSPHLFFTSMPDPCSTKSTNYGPLHTIILPQIIAVTETWCQPHEQDGLYSIPGYSLYRSDRPNKPGGGTLLYISVPSLTTSYSIHPMTPLNLHGAVSLPTKSPSPSAVSIDHLTAPTTSLYKHSSNVFVELNSTPTTPSLLGT